MGVHKKIKIGNRSARNFGMGTRCTRSAMSKAARLDQPSGATFDRRHTSLNQFNDFIEKEGIKDLRKVTTEHLIRFGEEQLAKGKSEKTVKNYCSDLNRMFSNLREDDQVAIKDFRKELNMSIHSQILTIDDTHADMPKGADSRVLAVCQLQLAFAARFHEAATLDARDALNQIDKNGRFTFTTGKNGNQKTWANIDDTKLKVLEDAAALQENHISLIPPHMSLNQFYQFHKNQLETHGGSNSHSFRKEPVCDYYKQETGVDCPIRAGVKHSEHRSWMADQLGISYRSAAELDRKVRNEIAEMLGHKRMSITNSYLG